MLCLRRIAANAFVRALVVGQQDAIMPMSLVETIRADRLDRYLSPLDEGVHLNLTFLGELPDRMLIPVPRAGLRMYLDMGRHMGTVDEERSAFGPLDELVEGFHQALGLSEGHSLGGVFEDQGESFAFFNMNDLEFHFTSSTFTV
jgi:hypothetical protein